MSLDTRPSHVCGECGGVNEDAAARIAALEEQVVILSGDTALLERELRSKRAQIKRLKSDQDLALRRDPAYPSAERVLLYWQRICAPASREPVAGKRLENCLARLHGRYTEEDLKRACDGYALKPYMVGGRRTHDGPKDDWRADAELIFRTAGHVDQGLRIADRADDLRQVLAQQQEAAPASTEATNALLLSPLGEAALRMASKGFYVFPVEQGGKRPVTPNGLKDAKRDLEAIRACWSQRPHLNVAVRTGRESGIVVLDIDGEDGWDSLHRLEDEHGELPTTASVTTPRGGQHFYFAHPGVELRNTTGFPGEGLDVRGDGGYVVAPPSLGPGGRGYEVDEQAPIAPMPQWLLDLLLSYQRKVDSSLQGTTDWPAFLTNAPSQGERNSRMTSYVGHLFGHDMDAREVLATARLLNAQVSPPLTEKELGSIVKSISRRDARRGT